MKQSHRVLLTYTKFNGFWPVQPKPNQVKPILIVKIHLQDMIESFETFGALLLIQGFYLEGTKLDGLFRRPIYCTGHFEHFYPVLYHKTVHRSSQTIKLTNFIKNLFVNRWSIIVIYNDDLTATPPNCCHLTFTKKLRLLAVLLRKMIISVLSNSVFEFLSITLSLSFNQSKNRWPYPRYQNQRRPKGLYQINKIKKENQLKIDSILQEVWGRL